MTRYARNLWRGFFSKFTAFFKVKSTSVLVQQGDLGGNVSVKLFIDKFDDTISYPHSYTDVIFKCLPAKHHDIH
jgi:hypothetical protein